MSEVAFVNTTELQGGVLGLLSRDGYKIADMHFHTRYSLDGIASIKSALKKCRKGNFGVAITDHNHIKGVKKAQEAKDVFVVPGLEVTCHNGIHILTYFYKYGDLKSFYEKEIKPAMKENPWFIKLNHYDVIDIARKYNSVVCAPHPFGPGFIGIKKFPLPNRILQKIDCVEVINSCCIGHMNTKAITWAEKVKKGFTGGSDGHSVVELGNSLTLCKADNVDEFLKGIKKKKSVVWGKQERILSDAVHTIEKFKREEKKGGLREKVKMLKGRFGLEESYLKSVLKRDEKEFIHYFHLHHHDINKKSVGKHKHSKHLTKYLR